MNKQKHSSFTEEDTDKPFEWTEPLAFDNYSHVPQFPIDVIPGGIGKKMIETVSAVNQIDIGFSASCYFAALSCAATGKFEIDLITHRETPNLYLAPALPSGERKSPTVDAFTRPIYEYEAIHRREESPRLAEVSSKRKILDSRIGDILKHASRECDPHEASLMENEAAILTQQLNDTPTPVEPTLIVDDITPESLGELMADNKGKMAIMSPEGGIFDILSGLYSTKGVASLDLYLKGYSGDPWRCHRIGRGTKSMDRPLLTVCLGIQPIILYEILQNIKFKGRGLLARFLFSYGRAQAGGRARLTQGVPDTLRKEYLQSIHELFYCNFPQGATLSLSNDAQTVWDEFYNDVEKQMKPVGKLYNMKDFGSKLPGNVARIAGLLHFAEHGKDAIEKRISVNTVNASCVIGAYFLEHAVVAFGAAGEDDCIKLAKQILSAICRHEWTSFKGTDILRKTSIKRVEEAATGIKILIERGYIREAPQTRRIPGKAGRYEAVSYEVNPNLGFKAYQYTD